MKTLRHYHIAFVLFLTFFFLLPPLSLSGAASISTENGLTLSFASNGDLNGFKIKDNNLLRYEKTGGFYVRDMGPVPSEGFTNGGFESEKGWSLGEKWYRDWKETHEGKWSVKLEMPGSVMHNSGQLLSEKISVKPEREYLLTFSLKIKKLSGNGINLLINQYDRENKPLKELFHQVIKEPGSKEEDWFKVYHPFKTAKETSYITISFYSHKSLVILWLDSIELSIVGNSKHAKLSGEVKASGNEFLLYHGASEEKHLVVNATISGKGDFIRVDGTVEDFSGNDRALILSFQIPIEARGWTWWDDIQRKREIHEEECYNEFYTVGKDRYFSKLPLSCINNPNTSISIAVPLNMPRIFRISYCYDRGYELEFDFGLSKDTAKFPQKASFSFLIYSSDPKWGMRSALKKYYGIFPKFFEKRNEREGIWFGWLDPEKMRDPEDFGLMFDSTAVVGKSLIYDNRHKIYAFPYFEPYGIGISWSNVLDEDKHISPEIPYSKIKDRLEEIAINQEVKLFGSGVNLGKAALDSAYDDENGKLYIARYKPYLFSNPDPDLNGESYGKAILQELGYLFENPEIFYLKEKYAEKPFIDGCYIDSIVPWHWANKENYNKEQFKYADIPLVFSYKTRKPVQLSNFCNYELISHISDSMHEKGKLMLGNIWACNHTCFAHLFDIVGAGEYSSDQPDLHFHYLRSLSYQKTLSFTDRELTSPNLDIKEKEKRLKKCLAYGVFPGSYRWQKEGELELPRELYKKYIPLIQRISSAGWEPIPEASSSHPDIMVERFGPSKYRDLYFTLRNTSDSEKKITLRINTSSLDFKEGDIKNLIVEELLSGKELKSEALGNSLIVQVEISSENTKLLHISLKRRQLIKKLFEIKNELNIFSNSEISTYKTENLLTKCIAPEKNSESIIYYFDKEDGLADSRIVQMKNNSNGKIVQLRIPEFPVIPGEFYLLNLTYKASPQEITREGFLGYNFNIIYNLLKFLSSGYLPEISVRLLFLDHGNHVLDKETIYFNEFTYTDSWKDLDKYFIAPWGSKKVAIHIKIESNRTTLLLKDLRLYSRSNALESEREINHVEEIKSFIKENLISKDRNLINLINELLVILEKDNSNEADINKQLSLFREQLIQFEKMFIFMSADKSLNKNNDILRFLWRLKIINSIISP